MDRKPIADPLADDETSNLFAETDMGRITALFHKGLEEFDEAYRKWYSLKEDQGKIEKLKTDMEALMKEGNDPSAEQIIKVLEGAVQMERIIRAQTRVEEMGRRLCIMWRITKERSKEVHDIGHKHFSRDSKSG